MKELKKLAFAQRSKVNALYTTSFLTGAVMIAQAYLIVLIVDGIFMQGRSFSWTVPYLGALLVVLLVRSLLSYFAARTGIRMASKVKQDFREALLKKFTKNPVQASLEGQSGKKVSVMLDAVDEVDGFYSRYIPQMILTYVVPLMLLVTIFIVNPYSGLIILITAPFIPFCMILIGKVTQKKQDEQVEELTRFSGQFLDTLQGLATLKLYGRGKEQREQIRENSLRFREATMNVLKVAFLSSLMLEFIAMLSIALIAVEVGLRLVIYESISFFTAFLVLTIAPEFFNTLKNLGTAFHSGRGSMAAANRIKEEIDKPEQPVEWGTEAFEGINSPEIVLKNVRFQYGVEGFALKEMNTVIPSNANAAVIGLSGSGKTTLLHILSGLAAPSGGEILINGKNRSILKEEDWFGQLSYISQHPYLFSGTIADNIALGMENKVTRKEIEAAAEKAGIASMVTRLEKGYDTPVGEGGRGLSGGEKQRVALARAFIKNPSLILFDEPTVGLDLETEQILQTSIKELSQRATVITVAHRLYTIKQADTIILLDDGAVAAQGTHEDLMENSADYRNMVELQQEGVEE
ncbi:thiol reductant ABC exporter subunit CydD [Bacillus sp. H-16]|uniref:thiol reductant ABC exporter subunit CydD n=1 Tax=Alteribacter salitolerans TaxID=2912333 RepID=UPI0019652208|nr:thiol reductant ABC exporter subunit CydD [Alteribacter salitolerans]MBM7096293.1 thiol reductant ABC exporter subunit CydD [Alteribacter salitolerans]